ncbi:MAG: hypothetical protein EOM20_11250 [Spartobacteria bacterium]|nr:hypothetical protein [Spartobacteria bacterium]
MNETEKKLMLNAVRMICAAFGNEGKPDAQNTEMMVEGLAVVAAELLKSRRNLGAVMNMAAGYIEAREAPVKNGG